MSRFARVFPLAFGGMCILLNACGKECVAWGRRHPDPDNPLRAMYAVDDGFATTAPVGSFPKGASPFGLADVVGNVWEWVQDRYSSSYYAVSPERDPTGQVSGASRILRGGSWLYFANFARSGYRLIFIPSHRSNDFGFRLARDP